MSMSHIEFIKLALSAQNKTKLYVTMNKILVYYMFNKFDKFTICTFIQLSCQRGSFYFDKYYMQEIIMQNRHENLTLFICIAIFQE